MPIPQHYTAADIAERLRSTPAAVTRLCRDKKIRATKPNGVWLITEEAVEDYLAAFSNVQDVA